MVSRYILVAVFLFFSFSLSVYSLCVYVRPALLISQSRSFFSVSRLCAYVHPCVCWYPLPLCVSVVCIRTSLVSLLSSSLSFFLWASVVGVCTRTSLYCCLFPGHSVKCVCVLTAFFVLTSFPRVRTMTAFAIPTSLQRLTPLSLVYIHYGLLLREWC
jgi:hypothetical protein